MLFADNWSTVTYKKVVRLLNSASQLWIFSSWWGQNYSKQSFCFLFTQICLFVLPWCVYWCIVCCHSRWTGSPSSSRVTGCYTGRPQGCPPQRPGRAWRSKCPPSAAPSWSASKRGSPMRSRSALTSMSSRGWTANPSLLVPQRKVGERGRGAMSFRSWCWRLFYVCVCSSVSSTWFLFVTLIKIWHNILLCAVNTHWESLIF